METNDRPANRITRSRETPGLVTWAMVAGPVAWATDLAFSYVLTQHSCSTGRHYILHVITAVCALLAFTGFMAGFSAYGALPGEATEDGAHPRDRTYFQVLFGMVFSIAFTVVVLAGAVPRWILSPCD
jgi:hypothetical protein